MMLLAEMWLFTDVLALCMLSFPVIIALTCCWIISKIRGGFCGSQVIHACNVNIVISRGVNILIISDFTGQRVLFWCEQWEVQMRDGLLLRWDGVLHVLLRAVVWVSYTALLCFLLLAFWWCLFVKAWTWGRLVHLSSKNVNSNLNVCVIVMCCFF